MEIDIRRIETTDAPRVCQLTKQLGYDISVYQTEENIKTILGNKDQDAFVAISQTEVLGWIGVMHAVSLEAPPICEIRGLVVDDRYRNRGIGKLLIERAKQWSKEKGVGKLRVRCNVKRLETHLFYEHIGLREVKQQKVFELPVNH
jgi:GNAT superfamily N-acetyltransferase